MLNTGEKELEASAFMDLQERVHRLTITHGDHLRVKAATGVSLYHLCDQKLAPMIELLGDPERLVQVVYTILEPVLDEKAITPEDFGAALGGDQLEAMGDAFMAALCDFFPNPQTRIALRELRRKQKQVQPLMQARMQKELDKATPEIIMKAIEAKIDSLQATGTETISSEPSLSLPASLDSAPIPSASASSIG